MSRPITVGLDGSAESRDAAVWAAGEAARRGLPLHLVHAWITEPVLVPPVPDEAAGRGLLEQVRAELEAVRPGLTISTELVPDIASSGLIAQAAEAEMLVLGSRGRGALMGFLLGSVGLPVIAHAARPVVLVRAGTEQRAEEGDEVVVALKDEDSAGPLLGFAFATAAAKGAVVRVVRVWGAPSLFGAYPSDVPGDAGRADLEAAEARSLTEALAPWRERFPEVPVAEQLRMGNPAEEVLGVASVRAGLLVVGRRTNRAVLGMRVGAVVHGVLHHAPAPVAVIPYTGAR